MTFYWSCINVWSLTLKSLLCFPTWNASMIPWFTFMIVNISSSKKPGSRSCLGTICAGCDMLVSQGIWHPQVKFPRKFGIPSGNMASLWIIVNHAPPFQLFHSFQLFKWSKTGRWENLGMWLLEWTKWPVLMEGRHNCMMSSTSLAHKLKFIFHLQNYQVGINNNLVDAYQLTWCTEKNKKGVTIRLIMQLLEVNNLCLSTILHKVAIEL